MDFLWSNCAVDYLFHTVFDTFIVSDSVHCVCVCFSEKSRWNERGNVKFTRCVQTVDWLHFKNAERVKT